MHRIEIELEQRILVLDGAMGTMIQTYHLQEEDFRNESLQDHPCDLRGNNDLLNITRPSIIKAIHLDYLKAGADIIETNTFNGNNISQADYDTENLVYEINYQGAKIAREAVTQIQQTDPSKPRFVAGAMGPTTRLASMSPDVNNPAYRAITFDQLVDTFTQQAKALIDGGVDMFLLETITDTLNAKAALFALMQLFKDTGKEYPIMVSGTITDASGRILSGQTVEAFLISIAHAPILSVGLNCALGAAELRPHVQLLAKESSCYVSTHPNAGLPNEFGAYDQSPEEFATLISTFAQRGWLNIVGGCCGTTPDHIEAIAKAVKGIMPRQKGELERVQSKTNAITNNTVKALVARWAESEKKAEKATFSIRELMELVSQVEDEKTFLEVRDAFKKEAHLYHSEQVMLLNAHIYGRYQYLRVENRLSRQIAA